MRVLSIVKISDNSGGRYAQCLKILSKSQKQTARIGDIVVVSIKRITPRKKIIKGSIQRGVVVRVAKNLKRLDGSYIRFVSTNIVLLNKSMLPIGTRVFGPVCKELRLKKFMKIISLAPVSV
jgi:large subunit ribosomal protein L14